MSRAQVEALVGSHADRIAEAVPEGTTSVSGSTLLGPYGGHDLDLVSFPMLLTPRIVSGTHIPRCTRKSGAMTGQHSAIPGRPR
jgi:hypothetical protein